MLTAWVWGVGTAAAQAFPPGGPPGAGGPPLGFNGEPPQAAVVEEPRPGGLKIGPHGLTVGNAGGLDKELTRNGNVPPPPPPSPNAPPPSADPRNFEGSWFGDQYIQAFEIMADVYGNQVPFNDKGRQVMDRRLIAQDEQVPYITPAIVCRPSGASWDLIRIPFRIFQSKDKIDVFSDAGRMWWQIPINPTLALPEGDQSYVGRSIGHWDGDTLVVETTGFKVRHWLSFRGTPVSPTGKLTQRIRKVHEDHWFLEIVTTVEDSTLYTRPWSFARTYSWRPDFALISEYNCEEQGGDKNTTNITAGFVREPDE
jgi:hypothetical protein